MSTPKPASPLRVARVAAGYTQPQLADLIDSTQTLISKYENGTSSPRLEIARKIAKVFDRTVDDLFPEPPPATTVPRRTVARRARQAVA